MFRGTVVGDMEGCFHFYFFSVKPPVLHLDQFQTLV